MLLLLFLALPVFAQDSAPQWADEGWRSARYPNAEWYTGFARDNIKGQPNSKDCQAIEKEAQNKLSESITLRISAASTSKTSSDNKREGNSSSETISQSYTQIIQASTSAEIAKAEIYSYCGNKSGAIYAFAAVRKSDLADYYAARVESYLGEAQSGIGLARQLLELDKRKDALEKLEGSKGQVDSAASYKALLIALDAQGGLRRAQAERASELLSEIALLQAKDIMTVFVAGTESIVVSGLQTLLSENGITVAETAKEAKYILKAEANLCNMAANKDFHYASACVKMTFANAKTGRNEFVIAVTGKKEEHLTAEKAGERAFKSSVPEAWAKIKDRILEN